MHVKITITIAPKVHSAMMKIGLFVQCVCKDHKAIWAKFSCALEIPSALASLGRKLRDRKSITMSLNLVDSFAESVEWMFNFACPEPIKFFVQVKRIEKIEPVVNKMDVNLKILSVIGLYLNFLSCFCC